MFLKLKTKETELDALTVEKDREIATLQKRIDDVRSWASRCRRGSGGECHVVARRGGCGPLSPSLFALWLTLCV